MSRPFLLSLTALTTALLGAAIVPACGAPGDEAIDEETGE